MIKPDFVLESTNGYFWNLKLLETKVKRTGVIIEEFGDTIYGIPLQLALHKIAVLRASKDFTGTLEEFLRKIKAESEALKELKEELLLEATLKTKKDCHEEVD